MRLRRPKNKIIPKKSNADVFETPMPLSVTLKNVSKRLSQKFRLENISLKIRAGEFFCLLGPSGSGKSTLLGLIGGWIFPDEGKIILGDVDYSNIHSYKRPVRTCFQKGGGIFPHMTVAENIGYALRIKKLDSAIINFRVKELMEQVGLAKFHNRRPSQLSGGEAQRVAIARTIADPQSILLLDEIQTGLDRHLRSAIRELLIELTLRLNVTTIYVTHDAGEALSLASRLNSRLGILVQGKLEQIGTPEEVYRSPRNSFIASLIGDINVIEVQEIKDDRVLTKGGNIFKFGNKNIKHASFVAIRLEDILFQSNNSKIIKLAGKVEGIEFLGAVYHVLVRAKGDLICIQKSITNNLPQIGDEVNCYIEVDKIILLPS